jgi:hypothetical protein
MFCIKLNLFFHPIRIFLPAVHHSYADIVLCQRSDPVHDEGMTELKSQSSVALKLQQTWPANV